MLKIESWIKPMRKNEWIQEWRRMMNEWWINDEWMNDEWWWMMINSGFMEISLSLKIQPLERGCLQFSQQLAGGFPRFSSPLNQRSFAEYSMYFHKRNMKTAYNIKTRARNKKPRPNQIFFRRSRKFGSRILLPHFFTNLAVQFYFRLLCLISKIWPAFGHW